MPLANARAVPVGWSQHHAPVAAGGMTPDEAAAKALAQLGGGA